MQSNIFHGQLFVYVLNLSFFLLSVCKKDQNVQKRKVCTTLQRKCLLREGDGLLFSLLPRGAPPAGPAFGGEGRIRSLLTQARATGMNLTSLLLVNLELA